MATLADAIVSSSTRPIRLRMRPDLVTERQRYSGKAYWVIKDPVGLKYYRFQEEEYAILRMLDGRASLEVIQERFQREFAPQKITLGELQQFIGTLHGNNLVLAEAPRQGEQLSYRSDQKQQQELLGSVTNILSIRFKGFDPEPILNWLYPLTSWFFTWWCFILCMLLGLSAALLVVVQWDVFVQKLPGFHEFFGPHNWLWFAVVLGVVKIIHEFGHGLACKHFGGECHEIGVMLLVLTPCLYCNVSDSWMLPNKWARAAIGAAGIYVEVVIASIATYIWWFSEEGLLNYLALRVMFICSVSTILFNGNPLLRYDGYYIMSDILEIPNLQQKSSEVLQRFSAYWCLGIELPEDPFLPQNNQWAFGLYTVASFLYRWFVFFSIMLFLNNVFEPYGLKVIGQVIALAGLFGLVVMPLVQLYQFLAVPGRLDEVKRVNVLATFGVVVALAVGIAFIPLPEWTKCQFEVRPADVQNVFATAPGMIQAEGRQELGAVVEAQEPILQLANPDLQLQRIELESQIAEYELRLKNLAERRTRVDRRRPAEDFSNYIGPVQATIATLKQQLEKVNDDIERLTVRAPRAGTLLPAPRKPSRPGVEGEQLGEWTGQLLSDQNIGAFVKPGDLICEVGDPDQLVAEVVIDQSDLELILAAADDPGPEGTVQADLKLEGFPFEVISSQLVNKEISKRELESTPQALATEGGGAVATKQDASGRNKPLSTSYQGRIPLPNADPRIKVGLRGYAKIYTGWHPLYKRIFRYLAQTFHFRL